mmetsp:Transcript_35338/g.31794  ORF Transcript_35338/g.31794 Transcript_35338/m.31794 type:complete len:243 (+) Transcript_35338:121-849(+)
MFECGSKEEKVRWVRAISVVSEAVHKLEEEVNEKMMSIDGDVSMEKPKERTQKKKNSFFDNFGKSFKSALATPRSLKKNEEYLKIKKLDVHLQKIEKRLIESRIMMGIVYKQEKLKWLFLISAKPLAPDMVDKSDECVLDPAHLPNKIKFDTLYIYDEKYNENPYEESYQMKDVMQLMLSDFSYDQPEYSFTLDMGQQMVPFKVADLSIAKRWVMAIQSSKATAKEFAKSKLPSVKNIFWTV